MILLLSNDDGIDAPGLAALAHALDGLGRIIIAAPSSEQSAQSHAFTMHRPLRVQKRGPDRHAVDGTPVDSVYIGVHHICPEPPAIVIAGINRGTNLGDDVYYSGTVAAAREAALGGIPALAVSLERPGERPGERRGSNDGVAAPLRDDQLHWTTAGLLARQVVERILREGLTPYRFLNLNVPNLPPDQLPEIRSASLGRRHYDRAVRVNADPRGRSYYWIGGHHLGFSDEPGTDGYLFSRGYATLVPLQPDFTDYGLLEQLHGWKGAGEHRS